MSLKKIANVLGTNIYVQHIEFDRTEYWHDVDGTKSLVPLMTVNNESNNLIRHQGEGNDFLHCQVGNMTFHSATMHMFGKFEDVTAELYEERKLGADPKYAVAVESKFASAVDLGTGVLK